MTRSKIRIALIGDYDSAVTAHQAIPGALSLAADGADVVPDWVGTEQVPSKDLREYQAIWCVPASPYRSMEGALAAIRYARESGTPYLGTCAGFQHAVLEFARDVLKLGDAGHEETDPQSAALVVSRLSCSLVEASETLHLASGSRMREIYGHDEITESYRCNFGLNAKYVDALLAGGLRAAATSADGDIRAVELPSHPFFFATLFQPERSSLKSLRHPLIAAFVAAAGTARSRASGA
jgi:CTP synthase (UTP-ammonia lyase)